MSDHWCFAYGSNLSPEQKQSRTGSIREARRALLNGYRIAFNKRGSDGTGKANIVAHPDRTVWGVIYRCSAAALSDIDRHEGVAGGHYARTLVRVRVEGGEELDAVTYVAGESFVDDSYVPGTEYLQTILHGHGTITYPTITSARSRGWRIKMPESRGICPNNSRQLTTLRAAADAGR